MTFAARMTRCPDPFEPERGDEAIARFGDLSAGLRALLKGAAGCSPHLRASMERESDWLLAAFDVEPEAVFDALLSDLKGTPEDHLAKGLRQTKRRVGLLVGLADLAGVWSLEQVSDALTLFADLAVQRALAQALAAQNARKRLPGVSAGDLETSGGLCVLAMGKMGAFELNYSSDIDLICLIDESRFTPDTFGEVRPGFVRATRAMAAMLSDVTSEGYVFRTDLRLRPDPSATPVALSMEAAERYYESLGRSWERAAHVKARPCAGDIAAGDEYLDRLRPFIWRRHLDFAAIQDAHDMRLRIRAHRGLGGALDLNGHDMKLGKGGIREIEFFTQTRQIIAGGRDPSLRVRGTVEGLARLAAAGWVPPRDAETLSADYRAHREVEHRLQMIADQQTHDLPSTPEGFARLAAFMGCGVGDLERDLTDRLNRVADLTEGFFAPDSPRKQRAPELSEAQAAIVRRWRGYPALRSNRAQEIFARLRPALLTRLLESRDPDQALSHLDGFLAGLPAGVQVFSLFESNPQLIDLIMDIADTTPDLAQYLARNAGVFDAVLVGSFFADWPGRDALDGDLAARLGDAGDYEARLDSLRAWSKEWKFRIGVHHLRGLIDAGQAGAQYSDVAETVLAAVWPLAVDEFATRHGPPPGRGAMLLGMGSLGARRLNAASDLDLIVIYDPLDQETSTGRRPLAARTYYARLTQALVTALSAPMAEGKLYEVDMRLRPSGRQGPVATSLTAYRDYQQTEAWTWEHLALTRARPVAGVPGLCDEIESFRADLMGRSRDRETVMADVAEMRDRLASARPATGRLDTRGGPGRLQDIELAASALTLLSGATAQDVAAQLDAAAAADLIGPAARDVLARTHARFWDLHAAIRLMSADRLDEDNLGAGGIALLLRDSDCRDLDALAGDVSRMAGEAEECVADVLGKDARRA